MKRIIAILLSISCIFVCACGSKGTNGFDNVIDDNYRNYYEIFVYSFADSNSDGIGDLKGVQDHLDYIEDLGCNGIWLMPVMPSTTYHKYDVTDYYDIDEQYGSLEDFDSLVDECHARKIRLIIDLVMNHTSSKHPWFVQAKEYLKTLGPNETMDASVCPYVNYYHFSKEKESNSWCQLDGTDFYYEAQFWSEMPDLNLADKNVRSEFESIATFWLEHGVDGFRMDAPLHFEEGDSEFNYNTLKWLNEYCISVNPNFYMVSEVWASKDKIAEYYKSESASMFDFSIADAEGDIIKTAKGKESAEKFVNKILSNEETYSENYSNCINAPFITNHDMGRVANALQSNEDDIKMAGALLLSLGGSPYIYYGEELGMKSKGKKDENKRLPITWDEGAIENCTGPNEADSDVEQVFDAAIVQQNDADSIYFLYKKCNEIRNNYPEIARGKLSIITELTCDDIAVTLRSWNDDEILIIYNTGTESQVLDLGSIIDKKAKIVGDICIGDSAALNKGELRIGGKSIVYIK